MGAMMLVDKVDEVSRRLLPSTDGDGITGLPEPKKTR